MKRWIKCWTAEMLLPLAQDGDLEDDVSEWLREHQGLCTRHFSQGRFRFDPPPCDALLQRAALERICRSFKDKDSQGSASTLPDWLDELAREYRAAPLPMTALAALSLCRALLTF